MKSEMRRGSGGGVGGRETSSQRNVRGEGNE